MSIHIEALNGPFEGTVYEFDSDKLKVVFGRGTDVDVPLDPDDLSLSRSHATLEFTNDRYQLRIQQDDFVLLDGEAASPDDELELGSHTLVLRDADGPSFRVTAQSAHADVPATDPTYFKRETPAEMNKSTNRRVVGVLVGLLVVIGIGYGVITMQSRSLEDAIAEIGEKSSGTESFAAVIRPLRKSVYLVALRDETRTIGFGTAWVVGDGVLATNAHVVEGLVETLEAVPSLEAVVVSTEAPYTQTPIASLEQHPHFAAFIENQDANVMVTDSGGQLDLVAGYDVGLLRVADGSSLAPALPLADDLTLYALDGGDEIAFIGFPMELAVGDGTYAPQPTPQMQFATITSVTDYFMTGGNVERNHLIQHSLPGHGGASGSPIFNRNGEVIALYSAGNMLMISEDLRISTGIGVNFGQRVDVLKELLEGTIEDVTAERQEFWGERLAVYRSVIDLIFADWQATLDSGQISAVETLESGYFELAGADNAMNMPAWQFQVDASQGGYFFFMARADTGTDIDIFAVDDSFALLAEDIALDSFPVVDLVPGFNYNPDFGMTVIVVGPETGTSFEFLAAKAP